MTTRKAKLNTARLYVVLGGASASGRPAEEIAREAVLGGADIIQLRMKGADQSELVRRARSVGAVVQSLGALFIVNDDARAALDSGADGVHVGQDDLSVGEVRRIVGADLLIGKSTHSIDQAVAAGREDVDYLGFGPMFSTPTKPDYRAVGPDRIKGILGTFDQPFFAIGGIDFSTAPQVITLGASRLAVVRAVQDAADVQQAARKLKDLLIKEEIIR
ncbi:MAG: thiamine phosphate synthase [Candidatus Omnitrophica bacterium]|jgi:thiamine-phosphate pyrophosphorylase|nr:thiamine phosphate synthase [Candidatus Omnitrophota bacterium]